jgi:hypothetical protein
VNGYLSPKQVETLLKPINPARVQDLRGMAYLAQHDVRAHLNRVFGFGRWSSRVVESDFIFEEQDANKRWKTGYRVTVELSVYAPDGTHLATYQDCHVSGNAPQPDRADAHALALTSAVSTGLKRCAINLGDQFGLSLYEKGSRAAIVKGTLMDGSELPDVKVTLSEEDGAVVVPGTTAIEPSAEVQAAHTALIEVMLAAEQTPGDRILAVAGIKTQYATVLDAVIEVDGSTMTLANLADRVAAGPKKESK